MSDLYSPMDEHASRRLGNEMSQLWKKEEERHRNLSTKSPPSLLGVLVRFFGNKLRFIKWFDTLVHFDIFYTLPLMMA